MADNAQTPTIDETVTTEATATATTTATPTSGSFSDTITEDQAWGILLRNDAVSSEGTYKAMIASVGTTDSNGKPLKDDQGRQYGIVNLRLMTVDQQKESEALMEAGQYLEAINNTMNFRITPNEFGKFSRGAMVDASIGMVDSIRQGKQVLMVTALTPQVAQKADAGIFEARRKARMEAKVAEYQAQQQAQEEEAQKHQA